MAEVQDHIYFVSRLTNLSLQNFPGPVAQSSSDSE